MNQKKIPFINNLNERLSLLLNSKQISSNLKDEMIKENSNIIKYLTKLSKQSKGR